MPQMGPDRFGEGLHLGSGHHGDMGARYGYLMYLVSSMAIPALVRTMIRKRSGSIRLPSLFVGSEQMNRTSETCL